jgi:SAM-dependent methyltransferase
MSNQEIDQLFNQEILIQDNFISFLGPKSEVAHNQLQTEQIFTDKWSHSDKLTDIDKLYKFQYEWFLSLYGFRNLDQLKSYLSTKSVILDAGCGLGYKASWFAELAPHATVIGIDISDAAQIAAKNFNHLPNLYFIKADIAKTNILDNKIDFVVCDQVIMHTENPEVTFRHLSNITKVDGEFACYVYSKKALPRELIDDFFRKETHKISSDEMWKLSEQLTELGRRLSNLNVTINSPDIPLLGIKGGEYDIQRFIYWNFLKCFWNEDWGFELSNITNYDWYAPSNAKRYSKDEFLEMCHANHLEISSFHEEEACYSGRFRKVKA